MRFVLAMVGIYWNPALSLSGEDVADNQIHVRQFRFHVSGQPSVHLDWCVQTIVKCPVLQATIGIDFLSKTMYLEDRTVSFSLGIWQLWLPPPPPLIQTSHTPLLLHTPPYTLTFVSVVSAAKFVIFGLHRGNVIPGSSPVVGHCGTGAVPEPHSLIHTRFHRCRGRV